MTDFTTDSIPNAIPREKTEYEKMAEHLSVLGLDREKFCEQRLDGSGFPMVPLVEKQAIALLLHGQAAIMGALAIFARDYDPELYVHSTTSSDTVFGGVSVEPGSVLDAVTRGMDRMDLEALELPTATEGHRWALWRGGERGATGEVAPPESLRMEPERPALVLDEALQRAFGPKPVVMIRLRDGRTHRVALSNTEWAHDGSGRDILAFEEPIPGD